VSVFLLCGAYKSVHFFHDLIMVMGSSLGVLL
jgi:hypothetical protein